MEFQPNHPDNTLFGGPNETENQRNLRDPNHPDNTLFGGPNETENQRNLRDPSHSTFCGFGGPNMTQRQKDEWSKPRVRQNSTPDMVDGGCGRFVGDGSPNLIKVLPNIGGEPRLEITE